MPEFFVIVVVLKAGCDKGSFNQLAAHCVAICALPMCCALKALPQTALKQKHFIKVQQTMESWANQKSHRGSEDALDLNQCQHDKWNQTEKAQGKLYMEIIGGNKRKGRGENVGKKGRKEH